MKYERLTKKSVDDGTVQIGCAERIVGCYHKDKIILERLAEIEDKIEQGYIKILPVKVGDKIYVVPSYANYGLNIVNRHPENNRVYEQTVNEIRFFQNGVYMVYSCDYMQNHHSEFFGETWFLEYEQAINRLKEMEVMYGQSKVKTGN